MKKIIILLIVLGLIGGGFTLFYLKKSVKEEAPKVETEKKLLYWTCGMHPSVRVSDEEYKKGKTNCPICSMPLIPVEEEPKIKEEKLVAAEEKHVIYGCGIKEEAHCPKCDEGIEDAECICGQHSFMLMDKKINCPVCGKELKEIKPEELKTIEESIVSRIKLAGKQLELAGLETEVVKRYHLTKEIRTVGRIAFDPALTVAQEEFLTALETREKVKTSPDPEVIKRANNLVEKSAFKLKLLGMSDEEISDLERQKRAQLNLILPEDKAWVYADIYEYELAWVKTGQLVTITTTAYPGKEFKGLIKSISPVINPMTRSTTVRIEADNLEMKLKPEMYVDVVIESSYIAEDGSHEVLAVSKAAVLDTGIRKLVYVDAGSGEFLGKEIKTGPEVVLDIGGRKVKMVPVIRGLKEGEKVVTKANFLIDSQSQLSGAAGAAYGGALGTKEEAKPPLHQH